MAVLKKCLPFIVFFLWAVSAVHAEDGTCAAEPLPFAADLPSQEITSLHQDRERLVWIGTTCGVARYDGNETTVFLAGHDYPDRLTDNYIISIADTEHYVFIGTHGGLDVFDKQTWQLAPARIPAFAQTEIRHLYTDSRQCLWVSTGKAVYRCDERLDSIRRHDLQESVTAVYEDRDGQLWVMTWGAGLFRYDRERDSLIAFPPLGQSDIPFTMFQDREGRHWIGTWGDGLFRFHPEREDSFVYERQDVAGSVFFDITQDEHYGFLWVLSYDSLHILRPTPEGQLLPAAPPATIDPSRMYSKILKDQDGDLWLGAYDAGYRLTFNRRATQGYTLPFIKEHTGFDTNLNCMREDNGGVLWFDQERCGIGLCNLAEGTYALHPYDNTRDTEVSFIVPARGENAMWVSSKFVPTVFRAEREGMHIRFTDSLTLADDNGPAGHITGLLEDKAGNLWVTAGSGVFVRDPWHRPVTLPAGHRFRNVRRMAEDPQGDIWLADNDGQFYRIAPSEGSITVRAHYKVNGVFTSRNRISSLCCDDTGGLWMATTLGNIYRLDTERRKLYDCTRACLPDMAPVLNLLVRENDLWIVTPGAVVRYGLHDRSRLPYTTGNKHIPVHTFRNSAACFGRDGRLYAGGHGGIVAIGKEPADGTTPPARNTFLTNVRTDGTSLLGNAAGHSAFHNDSITLAPDVSRLELSFAFPPGPDVENLHLAYRLEGLDERAAILPRGNFTVLYNRIPKGDYILHVWTTDDAGHPLCSPLSYPIRKRAAWYESPTAFIAYAVMFLLLLWQAGRSYAARIRRKNARLLREELTRTKMEYFTSMSHELLTPLTILSCLADEIGQKGTEKAEVAQSLRDNTERLKRLVRQVLDFRKIEHRSLPLQVRYGDAASFVRHIGQTGFALLSQKKDLAFHLDIIPHEIYGFFDPDKLEEILFNLLSNAIKYTPPHRSAGIRMRTEEGTEGKLLHIEVWDEGIGIAPEEQPKVFNRFYRHPQARSGESNGIGLALARELAALHHGQIALESSPGQGSRFTVTLPLDEEAYDEKEKAGTTAGATPEPAGAAENTKADATLLIVDDNPEITAAVGRLLGGRYRVLAAHSAAQAAPMLQEQDIDLMVCDLHMPGMNGLDFCKAVKGELATSHIPVIVLTAQDSDEVRAACYEAGADAYIAKPFEAKVLTARIDNLLHLYRQHRRQFRYGTETDTAALPYRDSDKAFLDSMVKAVEAHLQDSGFKLDSLAAELCLSKSTMNRKIKSMTGLTPMDFVRNIRLRTACRLLRHRGTNVSDAAYAVGFSDPKYFARCFKEVYGITPSQYQQQPAEHTPHNGV